MSKINRNHEPGEKDRSKPRILVAPLDWGLGHATRCVPVIYELLQHADVWLAAEGAQEALLRKEFPTLPFLSLMGYRVRYGSTSRALLLKLLLQSPRLLNTIRSENKWLKKMVAEYGFDAVISDNRFGLHHPGIPCVFMTHQLLIKGAWGKRITELLQKRNYRYINRFTACWVPDEPGAGSLAGELSHPGITPGIPVKYIGILSRLKKSGDPEVNNHLFISLSGPEPQRTILENIIIDQVSHYRGTATIVRGLPDQLSIIPSTNQIRFFNHLATQQYNEEMQRASLVICRSGYSTVMDLARLGKRSVLIPTPGQPEQEYLATYLSQNGIAPCISQQQFTLDNALEAARKFDYRITAHPMNDQLPHVIKSFIDELSKRSKL